MAELYSIENAAIAMTASTAKSVIVASAASNKAFRVPQIAVSCDATTTGTLKIEFCVGTLSGGTTGTAPTISRMNGEAYMAAPNTTVAYYTAEPSYTKNASNGALVVKTLMIPTPCTPYDLEYPLGREWYCPTSNVLGVRLTASITLNTWTNLVIEE